MKTVVGLFDTIEDARDVIDDLINNDFNRSDISLIARDYEGVYAGRMETADSAEADSAAEGAAAGAVGGGIIGGLAGFLVGISALAIPGVGPIVAAGPIVATLTGAGIGAATGGILGALAGWGVPEEEAEYYAEGVRRGGTLVAVKATDAQVDDAIDIMNDHNPVNIERRTAYWREAGWEGFDPEADHYTRQDYETEQERYRSYRGSGGNGGYGSSTGRATGTGAGMAAGTGAGMAAGSGDHDSYTPVYREHYQVTYGTTGRPFNYYEPGYRYGRQLANDTRYSTYNSWDELETDAHREWRQMNRAGDGDTWQDMKDAVRHGWESASNPFDDDEYDYRRERRNG